MVINLGSLISRCSGKEPPRATPLIGEEHSADSEVRRKSSLHWTLEAQNAAGVSDKTCAIEQSKSYQKTIDQFRYIKIQPKAIDFMISTGLWGIHYRVCGVYSPEPRAEVFISKMV